MRSKLPLTFSGLLQFLGTTESRLQFHLNRRRYFYRVISLPKKSGGTRIIFAPENPIKAWQYLIHKALSESYKPYAVVHAYAPKRSFLTNSARHVRCRLIVKADLRNFFGHIHKNRVRGIFCSSVVGANTDVGDVLARICTVGDELPAGAPTSPVISNLVCRSLDRSLVAIARDAGAYYSRYADDLTFSFKKQRVPPSSIAALQRGEWAPGPELRHAIEAEGFFINDEKFHVAPHFQRQMVTGVVVNARQNIKRDELKKIRAILFNIRANGYEGEETKFQEIFGGQNKKLKDFLRGKINYIRQVRGKSDFLSVRLCRAFNDVFEERSFVSTIGSSCLLRKNELNPAIFRLNAKKKNEHIGEGTAFAISPRHVLTCAHVVTPDGMSESELRKAWDHVSVTGTSSDGSSIQVVRIISICEKQDLVLLEVEGHMDLHFRIEPRDFHSGEEIAFFGYGRIGGYVRDPRAIHTKISSVTPIGGVQFLQSADSIFSGDSGGPAVDKRGRVIGVCARSEESTLVANGIISTQNRFFTDNAGMQSLIS